MYARPLWIIATGESRLNEPIDELKEEGHMVMGINRILEETPINYWHSQDVSPYVSYFQSIRGTGITAIIPDDASQVLGNMLRYRRDMIPQLGSGFTGLFLGACLGFDPIYLVGFDYHQGGSKKYYGQVHDGVTQFKERFKTTVYNTAKKSLLTEFPYRSFDDCRHGEC
jgi:hypothetical protein